MLELLSLFLAPLLVNVLSELFELWIKRRSK
nr:MAG TPA: toxin [Caudoviricetes sp.]